MMTSKQLAQNLDVFFKEAPIVPDPDCSLPGLIEYCLARGRKDVRYRFIASYLIEKENEIAHKLKLAQDRMKGKFNLRRKRRK